MTWWRCDPPGAADIQAVIGYVGTFDGSVPPYGQVSGGEMATLPDE